MFELSSPLLFNFSKCNIIKYFFFYLIIWTLHPLLQTVNSLLLLLYYLWWQVNGIWKPMCLKPATHFMFECFQRNLGENIFKHIFSGKKKKAFTQLVCYRRARFLVVSRCGSMMTILSWGCQTSWMANVCLLFFTICLETSGAMT